MQIVTSQTTTHVAYLDRRTGTGWLVLPDEMMALQLCVGSPWSVNNVPQNGGRPAILDELDTLGWRICDEEEPVVGELPDGREVVMLCARQVLVAASSADDYRAAECRFTEMTGAELI